MNKLEYKIEPTVGHKPVDANWDQRPLDAANITHWLSRQTEQPLNWQIVGIDAPVSDWHDSPILYLAGNQPLNFTAEQESRLRQFVEEGGLIVGNADCANAGFVATFKKLGGKLFPMYEFRELPANHPIYTIQWPRSKWHRQPGLQGQSNGARELMLLYPQTDPARVWQTRSIAGREEAFQSFGDIYLYAVDKKDFRNKGDVYLPSPDPSIVGLPRLRVARLEYASNWDPEPAGWRRLKTVMHNQRVADLSVERVKLGTTSLASYRVAHLTGTAHFRLPDSQRAEIKKFLDAGGTLIIDSTGGSTEFAESAEAEVEAITGTPAASFAEPMPLSSPLYTLATPPIQEAAYRYFVHKAVGPLKVPRLRAVNVKGRPAVFISREDLSVGLVGQSVDGVFGYTPASATTLMSEMLKYSQRPASKP